MKRMMLKMHCSYKNHDINEPAFFVGMALPPQP
jgi:hypothetical protein